MDPQKPQEQHQLQEAQKQLEVQQPRHPQKPQQPFSEVGESNCIEATISSSFQDIKEKDMERKQKCNTKVSTQCYLPALELYSYLSIIVDIPLANNDSTHEASGCSAHAGSFGNCITGSLEPQKPRLPQQPQELLQQMHPQEPNQCVQLLQQTQQPQQLQEQQKLQELLTEERASNCFKATTAFGSSDQIFERNDLETQQNSCEEIFTKRLASKFYGYLSILLDILQSDKGPNFKGNGSSDNSRSSGNRNTDSVEKQQPQRLHAQEESASTSKSYADRKTRSRPLTREQLDIKREYMRHKRADPEYRQAELRRKHRRQSERKELQKLEQELHVQLQQHQQQLSLRQQQHQENLESAKASSVSAELASAWAESSGLRHQQGSQQQQPLEEQQQNSAATSEPADQAQLQHQPPDQHQLDIAATSESDDQAERGQQPQNQHGSAATSERSDHVFGRSSCLGKI